MGKGAIGTRYSLTYPRLEARRRRIQPTNATHCSGARPVSETKLTLNATGGAHNYGHDTVI